MKKKKIAPAYEVDLSTIFVSENFIFSSFESYENDKNLFFGVLSLKMLNLFQKKVPTALLRLAANKVLYIENDQYEGVKEIEQVKDFFEYLKEHKEALYPSLRTYFDGKDRGELDMNLEKLYEHHRLSISLSGNDNENNKRIKI